MNRSIDTTPVPVAHCAIPGRMAQRNRWLRAGKTEISDFPTVWDRRAKRKCTQSNLGFIRSSHVLLHRKRLAGAT